MQLGNEVYYMYVSTTDPIHDTTALFLIVVWLSKVILVAETTWEKAMSYVSSTDPTHKTSLFLGSLVIFPSKASY